PQTPLFNKGETVYALDRARKTIAATGVAVLVEGYMDVMAAHQAGFTNVVSAMGTALTETQLRLIKKFAKRIVLALDADVAGDKATLRGLNVARETLERDYTPAFDARGLIRSEGKLQADIRVFTLPDGLDPDEVVNKNPDDWRKGVDAAEPIVDYVMRALTVGRDLDDPKTKSDVADEILPIIDDVADPIERDAYRQKLARLLKIDERALIQKTLTRERKLAARPAKPPPLSAPAPASAADAATESRGDHKLLSEAIIDRLESYCLSALVRHPDLVAKADRQLRLLSLTPLSSDDFTHTDLQIVFNTLRLALDQHKIEPHEHVELNLDELLQSRLQTLLDDADEVLLDDRQRIEDILFAVIRLRDRNVDAALNEMRFLQEDADEEMGNVYNMQVHALVQAKQKLTQARKRYTKRMERVVDLKTDEESN
ncbi:MAG: toprim domain-containing protein, partial [Chloroflexi bacterium]|nr:toprim domain-containing protein [Chloroflexota bacterium]